jgi:ABC-2 type transport system permease protein
MANAAVSPWRLHWPHEENRMMRHIAAFEWRYQVKSPVFWVGSLIFFLLAFGSVTVERVQIGARGNVHVNSPFAIVQTLAILSVFAVFVIVATW